MTAHASLDRLGAYWFCGECIESAHGFDDLEDAEEAAYDHNRHKHRGDGPDDDYYARLREERHDPARLR